MVSINAFAIHFPLGICTIFGWCYWDINRLTKLSRNDGINTLSHSAKELNPKIHCTTENEWKFILDDCLYSTVHWRVHSPKTTKFVNCTHFPICLKTCADLNLFAIIGFLCYHFSTMHKIFIAVYPFHSTWQHFISFKRIFIR